MISSNLKSHTIEITKPIIPAFKSGRQKYLIHFEKEKEEKEKSELEIKAMHFATDIEKLNITQKQKQN